MEIRKKIVATHTPFSRQDGNLIETTPGWTWIVEPEGYAACVSDEELKNLVGKTLKVIEVTEHDVILEINDSPDDDIRAGRVKQFDNPDEMIASLKQPW